MNRLILLGNGFDLAHGLRTSYHDFIISYLKSSFHEAYEKKFCDDELMSVSRNFTTEFRLGAISDIDHFIDFHFERGLADLIYNRPIDLNGTRYNPYFHVTVKTGFFDRLLTKCSQERWVDIENEYYEQLKAIYDINRVTEQKERLTDLNKTMAALISILEKYLSGLPEPPICQEFIDILKQEILKDDIVTVNLKTNISPSNNLILNFNYTKTIEQYLGSPYYSKFEGAKINYIHGQLGNKANPLIFGFGDEIDEYFLKIEKDKTRGFLTYIKSFWYFKTENYHNLIRFIDADNFQVFILGHSCGLSDRTMLNMIFEHPKCLSIKIFYYQNGKTNNFTELTEEISRHFNKKGDMRKKIVPFTKSRAIPQADKQANH